MQDGTKQAILVRTLGGVMKIANLASMFAAAVVLRTLIGAMRTVDHYGGLIRRLAAANPRGGDEGPGVC